MIKLLARFFIKDQNDFSSPGVRQKYGILCGACGILLNVFLFGLKLFVGLITGSIAVTADAVNNISDAGSSLVTMIGFRLAGKKPDPEHPFGHGRLEYISGLVVSMLIFVMGFELALSSVNSIKDPVSVSFGIVPAVILAVSMAVKLYMFFYNRRIGKRIASAAMLATASDSIGDVAATGAVFVSLLVSRFFEITIDGWMGLAVAGFILFSGFRAAKETIEPLLGTPPDRELVSEMEKLVLSHHPIIKIHDLILHDYGPGRQFVSLHAEVPVEEDMLFVHDVIDNVELEIKEKFGCEAVIHMDPIDTRDERLVELRDTVEKHLAEIDQKLTAHDFRIVPGQTHTNVIFDVVIPSDSLLDEDVVSKSISLAVTAKNPDYRCVIKIDRGYS